MIRVLTVALVLAAADVSAEGAATPTPCGSGCVAAYTVIAEALPHDRGNVLARAIVTTPGFDYGALTKALRVPTTTQVEARWPAFCRRLFGRKPFAVARCEELLLGSRPAA